jgi:hypothetical protein
MSQIPFVDRLGDAVERAAATRIAGRRGRLRRRAGIGALGLALAASGVAAASGVFSTPEQLAAGSVGCYEQADLEGDVAVLAAGDQTPISTCARVLGTDEPRVACAARGHVAVLPGGPGACDAAGLAPLPAGYAPARLRVNTLARRVIALEAAADCIPPRELASRVQRLLDRSGWAGWRTQLRLDVQDGPCGSVSGLGGDGRRTIEGALDPDARHVMVFGGASRSTTELLYGAGGLAPRLQDASGERCFTRAGLEAMARRLAGRALTFTTGVVNGEPTGARGRRRAEGCAIVSDVYPAADGRGVVVAIEG